jgi:hydrogenase nickel insertion protein HypA
MGGTAGAGGGALVHEFSVISSIVDLVKDEMEKFDNLNYVKEIVLEVGELTFLAHEALQFGFKALADGESKIKNDALKIIQIAAKVKCRKCGYEGSMSLDDADEHHISIPIFSCPECTGQIEILEGKGCTVRNLVIDLEEE